MQMKIKFLGGAEEVGRLGVKITDRNTNVLVDYGVIPEKPPQYPLPPEPIDAMFITHSHLDHIGAIPVYYHKSEPDLYATEMTANCMKPLLNDSLKVTNIEGYPAMFNSDDINEALGNLQIAHYNENYEIGDFKVTPYPAGHIPGSTMWKFENSRSIMVTGDINTLDTYLLDGAKPVKTDVLVIESTYAGKNHESRDDVKTRFRERIKEVVDNGGKVIIPAFAVGRTQEIVMTIADMGYDVSVDGMGNTISSIYLHTPGFLKSRKDFLRALGKVHEIKGNRMRENAINSDVIVSTSGMLDGGPVLGYIQKLLEDEKSAIFVTGYQVEGTNGRSLLETGTMNIAGVSVKPKMKVDFFDMSAHAGHDELVSFIKSIDPEKVILCHGDHREELIDSLSEYDVLLPYNGKEYEI